MLIIAIALLMTNLNIMPVSVERGPSSHYHPGDGSCGDELACGGKFTFKQNHIAIRDWWRRKCLKAVLVCIPKAGRCVLSRVRDGGPYGAVNKKTGKWKVIVGKMPKGWRRRGLVDMSFGLWKQLGYPKFLTKAVLIHLPFYYHYRYNTFWEMLTDKVEKGRWLE